MNSKFLTETLSIFPELNDLYFDEKKDWAPENYPLTLFAGEIVVPYIEDCVRDEVRLARFLLAIEDILVSEDDQSSIEVVIICVLYPLMRGHHRKLFFPYLGPKALKITAEIDAFGK